MTAALTDDEAISMWMLGADAAERGEFSLAAIYHGQLHALPPTRCAITQQLFIMRSPKRREAYKKLMSRVFVRRERKRDAA